MNVYALALEKHKASLSKEYELNRHFKPSGDLHMRPEKYSREVHQLQASVGTDLLN